MNITYLINNSMPKLTNTERKTFKELCKETIVRKLNQKDSYAFVNAQLKESGIASVSFDYVQKTKSEVSKSAKEELLHLEKDRFALVQSLFFDRRDQLIEMQKVLWDMIEKNKDNPAIQIQAIEKLQGLSDQLASLYHSLPYTVEFGAQRHFYIHDSGIMTAEQQKELDRLEQWQWEKKYEEDCAEMKKKYPTLSDKEIEDKVDAIIENNEEEQDE